jgi:hypothetical protein
MKTWMIKNGIDRINRGRFITNANMNMIDMNTEFKIPNMNNFLVVNTNIINTIDHMIINHAPIFPRVHTSESNK